MWNRCFRGLLCLLAALAIVASLGCNAFSAERQSRRVYVIRTDLDRIPDEIDWILGLDEPSIIYEDSFPPYYNR